MSHLEITTRDSRYVYPTGRIRGLEKHLLKDADLARVKEGRSLRESFQSLSHLYPYSESMKVCATPEDFEKGLEEEWRKTYRNIKSFAPEPELVDLFWLEQDFHNMKVVFKLHARGKLPQQMDKVEDLSISGTLSLDTIFNAVAKGDLSPLSPFLKEVFRQLMGMIEKGISARDIDLFLDGIYLQVFSSGMTRYKDDFLKGVRSILIDNLNIKNLFRIKLWEREDEGEILEEAIVEGGRIRKDIIRATEGQPVDSLPELLKGSEYAEIVRRALEEWREKRSLFTLDEALEENTLAFTYRGFYTTFGREALVNYVLLKKSEIRNLRGILRAKKAKM